MRTGHDRDLLELELARRRIPFVKYGGLRYLEAAHVKDLLALLRLADNPADELAWFRVLQLVDGVGPVSARARAGGVDGAPAQGAGSLGELARGLASAAARRTGCARGRAPARRCRRARGSARDELIAALLAARDEPRRRPAPERPARRASRRWSARATRTAPMRLQDLDQLVAAAHQARDPRHFVAELVLDPPSSSADLAQPPHLDEDYLVLSTIHSAKGLEWDAVHVLAVYDGNFPACMSAGTERVDRRGAAAALRRDDARAPRRCTSTCRSATTTARAASTTRTATARRRAS